MNKKIVYILITIFCIFNIYNISYANKYYEIGIEKLNNEQKQEINTELEKINNKYGINLDIILLGKDPKACYEKNNYIKCVIENYGITWNFIWTINQWIKEKTWHGDVNSFMNSNIQNIRSLFNENNLKNAQDKSISLLKNWQYYEAIRSSFLKEIKTELDNICKKIKNDWIKYNIEVKDCKINNLIKTWKDIERKKEIEKEKEKTKQQEINKNIIIVILEVIVLWIIIIVSLFYWIKLWKNIWLKLKIKKLFNDIDAYAKYLIINENLLDWDLEILIKKVKELLRKAEIIITNELITEQDIKKLTEEFNHIKKLEKEFLKTNNKIKEVEELENDIKDINI